jgi:hypothetical protein
MSNVAEKVGPPILVYPLLLAIILGAVGAILDDLSMLYVFAIIFTLVVMGIILDAAIGNKIKRRGKVIKQFEEGDIAVTTHCTRYMIGHLPIKIESDGKIVAKLWHGNTATLPLTPGPVEIYIYRNKHEKTKTLVNIERDTELFFWSEHGEVYPTRVVQMRQGEPLPETESKESYSHVRPALTFLSISASIMGVIFIILSLHRLGVI